MVFGMDTDSISPEENNLLRLIYVIKKPCTECLRHVLKNYIPSCYTDVKNAVSSKRIKLQGILTGKQNSRIFPQNQLCPNFDVYICDMSLLYILIRNVSCVNPPTTGWDNPVNNQPRDPSIGANVERLRVLRNDIIHEDRHEITDSEFNNFWSEIEASLADIDQNLGYTTFRKDLIYLRTQSLEPQFVQKEITKIRARKNFQEIKQEQNKQTVIIQEVNNRTTKIHDQVCRNAEEQNTQTVIIQEVNNRTTEIHDQVCRNAEEQNKQTVIIEEVKTIATVIHDQVCRNAEQLGQLNDIMTKINPQVCRNTDTDVSSCKQTNCGAYDTSMNDSCSSFERNICTEELQSYEKYEKENERNHKQKRLKWLEEEKMNPQLLIANEPSLPEGQNGVICVIKGYAYIKSELSWKNGVAIADHLLTNQEINNIQHEMLTDPTLPRRHIVDGLLKRAILGKSNELKSFFEALKLVSPNTARKVAGEEVTPEDISKFKQVTERAKGIQTDSPRSTNRGCISDLDIGYLRYNLSGFPDIVDSINDAMLSRFHFNATDHLKVMECETYEKKINQLFTIMRLSDVDAELELRAILEPDLYSEWIEYRTTEDSSDMWHSLRLWVNERKLMVHDLFRRLAIGFLHAFRGSIIFKFKVESGFTIDSLTPESIQQQIEDLLRKGSAETKAKIKSNAHLTVFIMSPDDGGQEEIHFYINFNARGNIDYTAEIMNYEKRLMSEELDANDIMEWMASQTSLEETTIRMLEEKMSKSNRSRKATMEALLDCIYDLENGRELLKMFSKESSPYVYKEVFSKSSQPPSAIPGHEQETALPYQRKGGLQKLFSLQIKIAAPESKGIAEGPDGFICLTKQYVFIKSHLLKKDADEISECLLKEELITKDEHETIADLRRQPCVDTLMKKIILGETDQMKIFFRALKSVNLKVFSVLEATKVTDEDRSRFKQDKECAFQVTNARSGSDSESILDDSDILFFQNCLSASREVVHSINDAMLARFNFSVRDHSNVLECKNSDLKIRKLCETMNLCDMDVENELKSLLRASLYEEWMEFRKRKGNHDRRQYLRWLNAPVTLVRFMFQTLRFNKAVNGIILKFLTGDGFDIASLTREFVQENVTDLLWKGYLETQINIKNPVHVMVFIMSPSKNDNDEIHFYLDFDATDDRKRVEDYKQTIADQERLFLLEQLDLIELTEWIMNQPDMEKTTKHMLEDKLSSSDMSRAEELSILLDSIYEINNGRKLIERFCKENDPDVYNNLFLRTDQDSSEMHKSLVQMPLQYERGGGLQRLYSFWMDIITAQKDIKISQETEDLQRVTQDKKPSKELPNPEVSYSGITSGYSYNPLSDLVPKSQKIDDEYMEPTESVISSAYSDSPLSYPEHEAIKTERKLLEPAEAHISDLHSHSSEFNPGYNIKKTENEVMEPTVWKCRDTAVVFQVGKLDEIWSDAMVIFGKGRSSPDLPRTIIEKVGPQIQREFQDKYPNGIGAVEVAVLSGFNLPVWKIFYCEYSLYAIETCLRMAGKLKMRSILFLVQERLFEVNWISQLMYRYCYFGKPISTICFHVDQDTFGWRRLREIAEDKLWNRREYFWHFDTDYRNPEPKTFNVGHMTVIIQVGKLEEIKSDALVIFEVAKEQWPAQNLPSEILEKTDPMIQKEFKEKFPAGLEYAEVAVLNGYNLPCRKLLYGVLPRWPFPWLKQVISVFLTECFQLASDEGITSIAFMIPSVPYHVAAMYASVLHSCFEMRIYEKPSLSISMQNIVIKDGCTGANMLKKVFEEEWARRIVFKEGHITVVSQEGVVEEILMKRGQGTQTCAILSEEPQENAKIPDSNALVFISALEDITAILEEISPSLKVEFRTKYPYALPEEEVAILDGYNNPFKKIYCSNYRSTAEVTDIILECFQMAENDKMNYIFLWNNPKWTVMSKRLAQENILGLRIFVIENPSSSIRRLYLDSEILRQEISDVTSVKVFKERHVTVVLNATYNEHEYILGVHGIYSETPANKLNSVHVICGVTDEGQPKGRLHEYLEDMTMQDLKQNRFLVHSLQRQKEGMIHFQKGFTSGEVSILGHCFSDTMRVFFGALKLDRQDMDMFFYKCIQKADESGVPSVTFLVPNIVRSIKLFASTLITCVKRFARKKPSSSIKRIYIRINKYNPEFEETKRVFEEEWAMISGEEIPEVLSQQIDEPQEKQGGKQGYPSEDIYLKKKSSISKLPEKSKEGSKYVPQEDMGYLPQGPHESSK